MVSLAEYKAARHAAEEAKSTAHAFLWAYVEQRRAEGASYGLIGNEVGMSADGLRGMASQRRDQPKRKAAMPDRHYRTSFD